MSALPSSETVLGNLRLYLLTHGWFAIEHANNRIEVLQTKPDGSGGYASVAIPRSIEFRDAGELINEAARLVASYENSPLEKIIDYVLRWDSNGVGS
jgi:hypothetical protein